MDAKVIPMAAYDLILGMDWLENFNPMKCDWLGKWLEFDYKGSKIKLQGILPSVTTEIKEISGKQVAKLNEGNDLWAAVLIAPKTDNTSMQEYYMLQGIPKEIQSILADFGDLFLAPTELPPSRAYDHSISLLPNTVPVNCRPYRYSPDQKLEIERQVAKMLHSSLVVPSLSPFASPVLMVKKKDGSWRFCVDYRKLNSYTIKNKFPMPIIDELLDEIAGARYFTKLNLNSGFH